MQILSNHFWKRWLKEYSPALQERNTWHLMIHNASVGDRVLVADDDVSGSHWPLGRVTKTFPGRDGCEDQELPFDAARSCAFLRRTVMDMVQTPIQMFRTVCFETLCVERKQ